MKLFEKSQKKLKNKRIKKYKFCGITVLRKEISLHKKKWNFIGIKLCIKRKIKKSSYRFSLYKQISHKEISGNYNLSSTNKEKSKYQNFGNTAFVLYGFLECD